MVKDAYLLASLFQISGTKYFFRYGHIVLHFYNMNNGCGIGCKGCHFGSHWGRNTLRSLIVTHFKNFYQYVFFVIKSNFDEPLGVLFNPNVRLCILRFSIFRNSFDNITLNAIVCLFAQHPVCIQTDLPFHI